MKSVSRISAALFGWRRRCMVLCLCQCFGALLAAPPAVGAEKFPESLTERPYEGASAGTVRAKLRCSAPKFKLGEDLKLEIELSVSGGAWLYNSQLISYIEPPGRVNLHDADGKLVCDLAFEMLGGSRNPDHRHFHWLEQGETFGSRKSILLNDSHSVGDKNPRKIVPGKHYVQLVYNDLLFAYPIDWNAATPEARQAWRKYFKNAEVLRSNPIAIEIVR